ncbi:OmpA family protein [Zhongshania borealis]|uniref:OmpA-like domain-containing protein n=1 Tax=Zhongshania borealis TaxID=889488 RepID=A0ABP7X2A9_9GAMM
MLISMIFPRRLRLCLLCLCLPVGAQAGLLENLLNQTGILAIVSPVTSAVGIELDDTLATLDTGLENTLGPLSEISSLAATDDLLAMDVGLVSADEGGAVSGIDALSSAKDQPALVPVTNIDPVFTVGRIQADDYQCSDSDGDGVCDQDDQCLKTPRGIKTLANGCYIDGPRALPLDGVFFALNSSQLSSTAKVILDAVVQVVQQSDAQRIEIGGHTDSLGAAHYNLRLSEARASAVRKYLLGQGVSADRLVAKGYGETTPRADNDTEAGREKNRRVELKRL